MSRLACGARLNSHLKRSRETEKLPQHGSTLKDGGVATQKKPKKTEKNRKKPVPNFKFAVAFGFFSVFFGIFRFFSVFFGIFLVFFGFFRFFCGTFSVFFGLNFYKKFQSFKNHVNNEV